MESKQAAYKRILVRAPNWIGDTVLAYPFFHYLRAAYPRAHIAVACVGWVEDLQFRNLVDEVIALPKAYRKGLWAKYKSLETAATLLRARGPWDLAISLPDSLTAAYPLYRAGARERRGYAGDARGWLLTDPVARDDRNVRHRAETYVRLLPKEAQPASTDVSLFWGAPAENELDPPIPGVVPGGFDPAKAWPTATPHRPPEGPYWVLAPGSTAESRRWPVEFFAELAREVVEKTGWPGIVVGGPAEAPLGARLALEHDLKLSDWTGQGKVTDNWAIFRGARFTVSNDSGLAHVASLCGSPVQITWGAGDPRRTQPMGPGRARLSLSPVACWPCEQNTCSQPPGMKFGCLIGIRPPDVWKEIEKGQKEVRRGSEPAGRT